MGVLRTMVVVVVMTTVFVVVEVLRCVSGKLSSDQKARDEGLHKHHWCGNSRG